jgi:hypothetical protein
MALPPVVFVRCVTPRSAFRQKMVGSMKKMRDTEDYGRMEWQGLVRTVERRGAEYRC